MQYNTYLCLKALDYLLVSQYVVRMVGQSFSHAVIIVVGHFIGNQLVRKLINQLTN